MLYVVLPLFIFFVSFVRLALAIPASITIIVLIWEMVRGTAWCEFRISGWRSLYFLLLAALWMWLAGGIGPAPVSQNGDWSKHNLIMMLLAERSWPPAVDLPHFGHLSLRYYIGWHLVPSLVMKLTHAQSPRAAASLWTMLGIFLFFSLLPDIVGRRSAAIAAPLVFMFFGGADIIGTRINNVETEGALYHFEWWAGWAQFSSNTTALFWTPQQALPAWLAIALLMRYRERFELLPYCALLASGTLLWSPLATIGLLPFFLTLLAQHGPLRLVLGWRPLVTIPLLALPVGLYLISGTSVIPHGLIWKLPCTSALCFTWGRYIIFLLVEVGVPLAILFARKSKEQGFLGIAAATLCLIPLYRLGVFNDFAMRASIPSLAVLAILSAKLFAAPRPWPTLALVIVLVGLPSVAGEFIRGFLVPNPPVIDLQAADETFRWWIDQTFVAVPSWVLR